MSGTIELQAGESNLKVPYTAEGLNVIRAMITLLEAELTDQNNKKEEPNGEKAQQKQKPENSPTNENPPPRRPRGTA